MANTAASFRPGAERGDPVAMYNLGWCYDNGQDVSQDHAQAITWYRRAAEKGYGTAMFSLGNCYYYGRGVPQDKAQAVQWFRQAAEKGEALAMNNLGLCYDNGQGVPQDYVQARMWYYKAIVAGESTGVSENNLGVLYETGLGVAKTIPEAIRWYSAGAAKGNHRARTNLERLSTDWRGQETARNPVDQGERERRAFEERDAVEQAQRRTTIEETLKAQVSDYTLCSACTEPFSAGNALLLPACLHAMCRQCLEHELASQPRLQCPTCHVEQPARADGEAYELHPVIERRLNQHRSNRCDQCDGDTPDDEAAIKFECTQCQLPLCEVHAAVHRTKAATRQHRLQSRATVGALPATCPVHSKPLEAYCHTCRMPICLKCLLSAHPANTAEHRTQLLDTTLVEELRSQIREALDWVNQVQLSYVDQLVLAESAVEETTARFARAQQLVGTAFADLRQMLSQREAMLLAQLEHARTERETAIEQTAAAYKSRWIVSASTLAVAQELASLNTDALVLARFQHHATGCLSRLVETRLTEDVPAALQAEFLLDAAVTQHIENAGELKLV